MHSPALRLRLRCTTIMRSQSLNSSVAAVEASSSPYTTSPTYTEVRVCPCSSVQGVNPTLSRSTQQPITGQPTPFHLTIMTYLAMTACIESVRLLQPQFFSHYREHLQLVKRFCCFCIACTVQEEISAQSSGGSIFDYGMTAAMFSAFENKVCTSCSSTRVLLSPHASGSLSLATGAQPGHAHNWLHGHDRRGQRHALQDAVACNHRGLCARYVVSTTRKVVYVFRNVPVHTQRHACISGIAERVGRFCRRQRPSRSSSAVLHALGSSV